MRIQSLCVRQHSSLGCFLPLPQLLLLPSLSPTQLHFCCETAEKMMSMKSKLGIVSHNQQQVPCLSMRSKRNNQQKQRQRHRASALTATQLMTTVEKESKEKRGSLNDYPQFQHKDINTQRKSARKLSDVWREVQGSNNWEGMVEPMDHLLRSELIKYGELAQACYDAFDFDHHSRYCGSCKYNRRTMLQVWRGTVTCLEWMADLMDFLKPAGFHSDHPDPSVKVESGFLNLYTSSEKNCRFAKSSAQEQIHAEVRRLIEMYKGEKLSITITGHSLGSALALLSAYDIAEMGINQEKGENENENEKIPVTVFSFAGPRVGNSAFKERLEQLGVKILRVVNAHDGVPKVPGILFNEHFQFVREWIDRLP